MLWKIDVQGTIGKQTALHVVYVVPHPCDVHMLQVGLVAVCELFFFFWGGVLYWCKRYILQPGALNAEPQTANRRVLRGLRGWGLKPETLNPHPQTPTPETLLPLAEPETPKTPKPQTYLTLNPPNPKPPRNPKPRNPKPETTKPLKP